MGLLTELIDLSERQFQREVIQPFDSAKPYFGSWLAYGAPTASGKPVNPRSAIVLASVYHAIELISDDYASLPYAVYKPKNGERVDMGGHPVDKLLNYKPNYYQTPMDYRRMMAAFRLSYGNAYAIIDRFPDSAEIRNFLPVHPTKVGKIQSIDGVLYYPVKGVDLPIPGYNMIHVRDLTIEEEDFKGMSRIDYAREMIGRGLGMDEFSASFFGNGTTPGLVFESDIGAFRSEEQRDAFEESLVPYKGTARAYSNLVLPEGVKLSTGPKGFNNQQTQFIETKIHHVEEVAQLFNLPLNKMRIKTDGNSYNSQEQANIEYITDRLRPFCKGFEQEYNLKAFKPSELGKVFAKVSLESRMRGDTAAQTEHVYKMLVMGVYNRDQAREYFGMNPIEGGAGKDYYLQSNQMKLGQTGIENGTNE